MQMFVQVFFNLFFNLFCYCIKFRMVHVPKFRIKVEVDGTNEFGAHVRVTAWDVRVEGGVEKLILMKVSEEKSDYFWRAVL